MRGIIGVNGPLLLTEAGMSLWQNVPAPAPPSPFPRADAHRTQTGRKPE